MSTPIFYAGRISDYIENWRKITSDENVLDIVQHCHIEFGQGENPVNSHCPKNKFTVHEEKVIDDESKNLLDMAVIEEVDLHPEEYISPIFVIPKTKWRI